MSIFDVKKQLRKKVREISENLCSIYKKASDDYILKNLLGMEEFKEAKTVFCFVGTKEEINTYDIIEQCFNTGKTVCVPKCLEPGHMEAFIINSIKDLTLGKFNIMEPKEFCVKIEKENIDLCIVPCVSCNSKGQRLGYGGGYYDRYLKDFTGKKINICREKLMLEDIPMDENDVKMDVVVTEKNIYHLT
ncbi:5-formyltetrahydrofolate cyclo-ligase [Hathewaya proteolytica DSM 3090]|uniref:5-formyltetrahydrofolate cyclo-ligase n=1 Tax=Hathewaya proteolytica DSM 3090 TaxID=1121331 RepID=A0A1M6Q5X2_9CLOT|nr:5-formyltetrahydrofolate cyclo-ligase [Hathewaya proteolytica]SHK15538.1 5-formyltetrahydrofolate cyclo-ligase [Hathewaya proteolytica DSM 3090]